MRIRTRSLIKLALVGVGGCALAIVLSAHDAGRADAAPLDSVTAPVAHAAQPVVQQVAPAAQPVVEQAAPLVRQTEPVTQPVVDTAHDAVQQTAPVTDTVAPVVGPVAQTVGPVADTARPIVQPVVDTVRPVVQPIVEPVVDTARPIVQPVVDTARPIVQPIVDTARPIVQPIVESAPVLEPVIEPVRPIVQPIVVPLAPIIEPVTPGVSLLPVADGQPPVDGPPPRAPVPSTHGLHIVPSIAVEGAHEALRTPIRWLADGDLHRPARPRPLGVFPPRLPSSLPALPATDVPLPGGHSFPGSLAVLVAVAAAASLVARRMRYATPVWPSLAYASLIERPG